MSVSYSQSDLMMNTSDGSNTTSSSAAEFSGQSHSTSVQAERAAVTTENLDLEDYETQLFGFTPKSFVSGSK